MKINDYNVPNEIAPENGLSQFDFIKVLNQPFHISQISSVSN